MLQWLIDNWPDFLAALLSVVALIKAHLANRHAAKANTIARESLDFSKDSNKVRLRVEAIAVARIRRLPDGSADYGDSRVYVDIVNEGREVYLRSASLSSDAAGFCHLAPLAVECEAASGASIAKTTLRAPFRMHRSA